MSGADHRVNRWWLHIRCTTVFAVALVVSLQTAHAEPFQPTHRIPNPAPAVDDEFGRAVALVGNNVIVGAQFDDGAGTDAGAAYLFDGTTGELLRTFLSPNPRPGDFFGMSVAAVVSNVLVGAPNDSGPPGTTNIRAGAAYLFDSNTGALLQAFR